MVIKEENLLLQLQMVMGTEGTHTVNVFKSLSFYKDHQVRMDTDK